MTDKLGYAVWPEIPVVKQFTETGTAPNISISPTYLQITEQQLTEEIKQLYNHPSIMFWSLSNEIPNNDRDANGNYLG